MTKTSTRLATLLSLAAGPLACSTSGPVNIGDTKAVGAKLSDYAASWDGYAEAYTFMPSGSDRVRLNIDANGQGTLQVGDGALLPPPTDPNVGYPLGADDAQTNDYISVLREGALYPIYAAQVQTARIQVGANPRDLYRAWCALQTPVATITYIQSVDGGYGGMSGSMDAGAPDAMVGTAVATTSYGCLPNYGGTGIGVGPGAQCFATTDPTGTQSEPVDCGKFNLCESARVCACTATSCVVDLVLPADPSPSQYPVELDAALDTTGAMLTGTLLISGNRITVHLQKQ